MKLVFCYITWVNAEGSQNNAFKNALSGTLINHVSLTMSHGP